jgi:hypothetical protein
MKKRYIRSYCLTLLLFLLATVSCTDKFSEFNTNPTTEDFPPTNALLTQGMILASTSEYESWRANFIYSALFVQQLASLSWQGDKYFYNDGYSASYWDRNYEKTVKILIDVIYRTTDVPAEVNYNSIARILNVLVFQRMTDLYGDVPYSQAGRGYLENILVPEYDSQEFIYSHMLTELEEAINAFDEAQPTVAGDIIYGGDLDLWKKGAYSLMLRVAMRLSKVAPEIAEEWAAKAVAGGVIGSYTEALKVTHTETTVWDNPNSHVLGSYPGAHQDQKNNNFRISKTFIDLLRNNNDPRLEIIPVQSYNVVAPGDTVNIDHVTTYNGTANPAAQLGLPNGLEPNDLVSMGKSINRFSIVRSELIKPDAPNILVSHAQTLFLQAEAVERGWISGDAEALFRAGVQSAIDQLRLTAPASLFNDAVISDYAQNDISYPAAGTLEEKLEAINTQYYIASFLDGIESFSNWRRSGYPTLTPVNFAGNVTNGTIPRRLRYPANEYGLNAVNLEAALTRQGPDTFTTRVWWDSE